MLATSLACTVRAAPPKMLLPAVLPEISTTWRSVPIGDDAEDLSIGEALKQGAALVLLDNIASAEECAALASAASKAARSDREKRRAADLPLTGLVRVPTVAAAERASISGTPCAKPLSTEASDLADVILRRVMEFVDVRLPSLTEVLFKESLCSLEVANALEFSSREPSLNVYTTGGEFLPHQDHQSLTVLMPLTAPDAAFSGGGTAFWHQDARGHRVEAPTVVLRPPPATAMLFGGHVTHAGVPVEGGERVVLVASFSRITQGGRERRAEEAARARDIYGDAY